MPERRAANGFQILHAERILAQQLPESPRDQREQHAAKQRTQQHEVLENIAAIGWQKRRCEGRSTEEKHHRHDLQPPRERCQRRGVIAIQRADFALEVAVLKGAAEGFVSLE